MISVSDWFKTWMEKPSLTLLRKFVYDDVHESERVQGFGSINRASDAIVSGGTSLSVINADKHWNKFIDDKLNLRRTAKLQLGIAGKVTTIARAGVARAGITAAGLVALKAGSTTEAAVSVPRAGEWIDILTGWADDPAFDGVLVDLPIRDKFARLLEKELGSDEAPLDYYSAAYNPADLTWSILTVHGGFDDTESTENTDIDYSFWLDWKTACTTANFSLRARFTGQTIREALELIRDLTNSDIYQDGAGKIKCCRFTPQVPPSESRLFDTDRYKDFVARIDSSQILNRLLTYYGPRLPDDLVTNGDMEATNSWLDKGTPTTNARSGEQKYEGSYSRKVVTDVVMEGAYQDLTTVVGKSYRVMGYVHVSQGDAVLGVGGDRQVGNMGSSIGATGIGERIWLISITTGFTGKLESIKAYLYTGGVAGTHKVKCAIYKKTNGGQGDLVPDGTTEEKVLAQDLPAQWVTFSFPTKPSVSIDTDYYLAIWSNSSNTMFCRSSVAVGTYYLQNEAYDGWPSSVSGGSNTGTYLICARFDDLSIPLSHPADQAEWVQRTFVFEAEKTTSRLFFESDDVASSIFYVDNLSVREIALGEFADYYLKEDAASQQNPPSGYGLASRTDNSDIVWHATLLSAISYTDRRVNVYKNPLEIVSFTSFMMGMITEVGDIIRVTNSFYGYSAKWLRITKVLDINLAAGNITFEAGDYDDILVLTYSTPSDASASSEAGDYILNQTLEDFDAGRIHIGDTPHVGQRITLTGATLSYVRFKLKKVGSPTGAVTCTVRKAPANDIIETSATSYLAENLTGSYLWYEFALTCSPNEAVDIFVEFHGGDGSNYVYLRGQSSDVCDGYLCLQRVDESFWERPGLDCTIILYSMTNGATLSIDESTATYWLPSPENEVGAWISWDMGSVKWLDGCRIYWGAEVAYRPTEYKIYTSVNGDDWDEVIHETEAAPASAWKTYEWTAAQVRYFKLVVTTHGSSGTKVYEVEEHSY